MGELSFEKFYATIKEHFSTQSEDYESFKKEKTTLKKLKYLLDNEVVAQQLSCLENAKALDKTKPKETTTTTNSWKKPLQPLNSKSENFPQMSSKIRLGESTKSGRCLIAKEKIMAGK